MGLRRSQPMKKRKNRHMKEDYDDYDRNEPPYRDVPMRDNYREYSG